VAGREPCRHTQAVPVAAPVRKIRFDLQPWEFGGEYALVPYVDNVSLIHLVAGYEHAAGFDVAGKYAGLVLGRFSCGDLTAYLGGRPDSPHWARLGVIALLGCTCGEVGCWPLYAQVIVDRQAVTWRGFHQPFRQHRDYGSFGPFAFRRTQYDSAVRQVAARVLESLTQ
jgi:hypothetical protein